MLTIGNYKLKSKVLLAPMAGTSDKPFRILAKKFGAALATSEMVLLKQQLLTTNKSKYRLDFNDEVAPISLQIAGSSVEQMTEYAQQAQNFGADIIDINMGCPAKKVCNTMAGSALMRDEKLAAKILTSVISKVNIPVTLKIRTGWDNINKNAIQIAKIAEDCGVKMLTIHGRTRADKYNGEAEYQTIKAVVDSVNIPIIANGDIKGGHQAQQVLDFTGASGVMIGRATQGQPWIIKQIIDYLTHGKSSKFNNKKQVILKHINDIYDFYPESMAKNIAKKHIKWYLFANNLSNTWQQIHPINDKNKQYEVLFNILKSNSSLF